MNVKLLGEDMYRLRDLFTIEEINCIMDEFNEYYPSVRKKEKSNEIVDYFESLQKGPHSLGDSMTFISLSVKIDIAIRKTLRPKVPLYLQRINTNIMHPGQNSDFHNDAPLIEDPSDPDNYVRAYTWTFLLFCSPTWNTQWGGEFCMQTGDKDYQYASYIPGDGILFRASRSHKGCGPNTTSPRARHSVAWTYVADVPCADY